MLTFSVNTPIDMAYALRVCDAIDRNVQYFKKFNKGDWEEAVHRTFLAAVQNKNDGYADLDPYIKNLARNILKTTTMEQICSPITEDGEEAYQFIPLAQMQETTICVDNKEIMNTFKEAYLMYPDEFLKLTKIFEGQAIRRPDALKNSDIQERMNTLSQRYGVENVINSLYEFLRDIPEYIRVKTEDHIKEIELRALGEKDILLDQLPDIPMIKDEKGGYIGIQKETLRMYGGVDPDYIKWELVSNTTCDVLKVDITPLMDYMYRQVYVSEGVSTQHITWCGEMYKVTTPAGEGYVNLDRDKFIQKVRIELIKNLINSRLKTIIALSPDSVYIKPVRFLTYTKIRLILKCGKVVDLPVSIEKKKR